MHAAMLGLEITRGQGSGVAACNLNRKEGNSDRKTFSWGKAQQNGSACARCKWAQQYWEKKQQLMTTLRSTCPIRLDKQLLCIAALPAAEPGNALTAAVQEGTPSGHARSLFTGPWQRHPSS